MSTHRTAIENGIWGPHTLDLVLADIDTGWRRDDVRCEVINHFKEPEKRGSSLLAIIISRAGLTATSVGLVCLPSWGSKIAAELKLFTATTTTTIIDFRQLMWIRVQPRVTRLRVRYLMRLHVNLRPWIRWHTLFSPNSLSISRTYILNCGMSISNIDRLDTRALSRLADKRDTDYSTY